MTGKSTARTPQVETVTIDHEAYQRLEEARGANETVSEVIKRCVRPLRTAEEVLQAMRRSAVSARALRSIDESASRRRSRAHRTKK